MIIKLIKGKSVQLIKYAKPTLSNIVFTTFSVTSQSYRTSTFLYFPLITILMYMYTQIAIVVLETH